MLSCRICLESLKKPVSLPCGHIFCSACILKTVQAVKPYSHLHPCPICRSIYNIAPINFSIVPPNLRPFVTPSVRKLYIDNQIPQQEEHHTLKAEADELDNENETETPKSKSKTKTKDAETDADTDSTHETPEASEIARLRAENLALRNNCYMWRKRAEMHGTANLGLLNFARVVRDQASVLARERDQLEKRVHALKRKIEDVEYEPYPELEPLGSFLQETPETHALHGGSGSGSPDPGSLLFAPHPIPSFTGHHGTTTTGSPCTSSRHHGQTTVPSSSHAQNMSGMEGPRKKTKVDDGIRKHHRQPSDDGNVSMSGPVPTEAQRDALVDAHHS